ncbi:hypothetical protein PYCCODRAFT_1433366 [Trametes coccinea BRFM310]|uniref:F-box domain-containing protein n=1 Tax=Trametes coccinea (strain BRFM310) TaxID=1353009 RepID=A0A1Y2ITU4_TRAC3|nr:hypothetical protein PYCCODRAFT_1433366 [Trametes coccinea BRFM310]
MSSASIGDLAVETLQYIFSYACTDDGYTGYSLTLVSKAFRAIVHPIRFHRVALHNVAQVESFAVFMDKQPVEAHVPRVQHLFISTWADGQRVARIREVESSRGGSEEHLAFTEWASLAQTLHTRLSFVLPRVLQTVSPALRTFTIIHALEMGDIPLNHSLPHLEELTSFGWVPYGSRNDEISPLFPALRRLHIGFPVLTLRRWIRHTPCLTHLRLSEVSPSASTLPDELSTLLDDARPSCPDLRIIRLQQRRIAIRDFPSTAMLLHNLFALKLKLLETSPCKDRLELLKHRRYRHDYWNERLKQDWLERIVDDPGCWSAGEQKEEGGEEKDERVFATSI